MEQEKWVGGLSECCDAPCKEIGEGFTILICSECKEICNRKWDEEDDYPSGDDE